MGMWTNRRFTDAVVVIVGKRFAVHRSVLSEASPVFYRAFSGSMREASKACYEVKDSTPDAVEAMLKYVYTGAAPKESEDITLPLLELAVQYELADLCEKAANDLLVGIGKGNVLERM